MNKIDRFLRLMNERGASDFHLTVGRPPMVRAAGSMETIRYRVLTERDFAELLEPITAPALWKSFVESGDIDFSYEIPGRSRYRVNLFNETRSDHVLTMEDPVEFVHPFKNCLINQREVGTHTGSF
ncbi:MAG TPA: hypothetical protein VE010_15185, partial [Thermoanaerobaculia bacterium]|nr:hypothetical protein [Thermoanaerobaculia bacterium]